MKINFKLFFILVGLTVIFSSCRTSAPRLDYQALARASVLLGIDINLEDDHKLYLEAADWIGAPYRGGGDSKRGTDCSGMVYQIYRKVYRETKRRFTWIGEIEDERLLSALENLSDADLELITLYAYEEYDTVEISKVFGTTKQNISKKIRRITNFIKNFQIEVV